MEDEPRDESAPDERKPQQKAWPLLKRAWPLMRRHMRYVWVMVVCLLLSTPLALVSPLIIKQVVDDLPLRAARRSRLGDRRARLLAPTPMPMPMPTAAS